MKRVIMLLALLTAAALPAAAPSGALPLQVTCFGEVADAAYHGTSGPDTFYGTPGDDVMIGWEGDDLLYGNGGRDRICGGDGNDVIYGGPGGDSLNGDWGNDRVYGQGGNDGFLLGGDGNDLLVPGTANMNYTATIEGGAGRDRIVIGRGGYNEVFGGAGRDTIDFRQAPQGMAIDLKWGEFGNNPGGTEVGGKAFEIENVFGSPFDDVIWGNAGANDLFGFGGADILHGRNGDDYLDGGTSVADWIEGDGGTDTCTDPDGFAVGDECEIWP
jgi:Ca2+-binding RTX toxin-like protein